MSNRPILVSGLAMLAAISSARGQDSHGRRYKAPPETSHIEVLVLKDMNHKPVAGAAVVFHSTKDGKDEGNLEVKTNEQGRAEIDVIPTGSNVDVQVIAEGMATFAGTYLVTEAHRAIEVRMTRPRAQVSTYADTRGQTGQRPEGIQEPKKPTSQPNIQDPIPTNHTSDPTALTPGAINDTPHASPAGKPSAPLQTSPPNMHPDNQYPLDPASPPKLNSKPPAAPAPPQL